MEDSVGLMASCGDQPPASSPFVVQGTVICNHDVEGDDSSWRLGGITPDRASAVTAIDRHAVSVLG